MIFGWHLEGDARVRTDRHGVVRARVSPYRSAFLWETFRADGDSAQAGERGYTDPADAMAEADKVLVEAV